MGGNNGGVRLRCDAFDCGALYPENPVKGRHWGIRRKARSDGWTTDAAADRDLCPEHSTVPPEVQATFDDFWADIVTPGGHWDLGQVMRELHDYRTLLNEVPTVYYEVTAGRISKPNTHAFEVIGVHDELFVRIDDIDEDWIAEWRERTR